MGIGIEGEGGGEGLLVEVLEKVVGMKRYLTPVEEFAGGGMGLLLPFEGDDVSGVMEGEWSPLFSIRGNKLGVWVG